jgi:hypothetical protein
LIILQIIAWAGAKAAKAFQEVVEHLSNGRALSLLIPVSDVFEG